MATNKARKERLAAIARDRLGYQEYLDLRESIDKNISSTYAKLQKKDVPKIAKKKKKGVDVNGHTGTAATINGNSLSSIAPHPAALGLNPDDDHQLVISEHLKQLVETRRQWVDTVGGVFDAKQEESPGRIWGLPSQSIFDGLEDEVKRSIEHSLDTNLRNGARNEKGKEKEKARQDGMDVG